MPKNRPRRLRYRPPPLTEEQILTWADQHCAATGRWPRCTEGGVAAPAETWRNHDDLVPSPPAAASGRAARPTGVAGKLRGWSGRGPLGRRQSLAQVGGAVQSRRVNGSAAVKRPPASDDRCRLLRGPYRVPALKRGERAFCLFRGCVVVVTGLTDAPIQWPRCCTLDPPGGGRGLLVDDELARAVRSESALALCRWWGVSRATARRWRKALGVGRMDAEGSRRLILANISTIVAAREPCPAGAAAREEDSVLWAPEELALVGAYPDAEVARRTGRSKTAVQKKRRELGRPNPKYPHYRHLRWTPEDDALALTLTAAEAAARTGHTRGAVVARRAKLRELARRNATSASRRRR